MAFVLRDLGDHERVLSKRVIRSELHFGCCIENKVWGWGKARRLILGECSNLGKRMVVVEIVTSSLKIC